MSLFRKSVPILTPAAVAQLRGSQYVLPVPNKILVDEEWIPVGDNMALARAARRWRTRSRILDLIFGAGDGRA